VRELEIVARRSKRQALHRRGSVMAAGELIGPSSRRLGLGEPDKPE